MLGIGGDPLFGVVTKGDWWGDVAMEIGTIIIRIGSQALKQLYCCNYYLSLIHCNLFDPVFCVFFQAVGSHKFTFFSNIHLY